MLFFVAAAVVGLLTLLYSYYSCFVIATKKNLKKQDFQNILFLFIHKFSHQEIVNCFFENNKAIKFRK